MNEFTVTFQHVEPDVLPIDFQGVHMLIEGPLAWFYRLFQSMDCEEKAVRELYPWLMAAKKKWLERKEKAANAPQQTAAPVPDGDNQVPTEIIP